MEFSLLIARVSPIYLLVPVFLVLLLIVVAQVVLIARCLKTASADQAIIRNGTGGMRISLDRMLVIPFMHSFEIANTSVKRLRYERDGENCLVFRDGTRAKLIADLIVRINRHAEDVKRAATMLGVDRLNDEDLLRDHFSSMFHDSLETIAGKFEFEEFSADRERFRNELIDHLGNDLQGLALEDICLHHLQPV